MRALVAPLELKGTLRAPEAAEALRVGLSDGHPALALALLPWADGGPGTLDLLVGATGGRLLTRTVQDPLGRPVAARFGLLGPEGATAVVEMAEASGLHLLAPSARRPLAASTHGTGELMAAALGAGARELLVAVGGSATTDGGTGALTALGLRFLGGDAQPLPPGGGPLAGLAQVDGGLSPALACARVTVLTDVDAPLLGPSGAAALFGPQKGASPEEVQLLERGLARLAQVAHGSRGAALEAMPGAGAAGGLAFGLAAFADARLAPAFETLAERTRLCERLTDADLLVTAEGRLDRQTLLGKGPYRLAREAKRLGKRTVLFVGAVAEGFRIPAEPWDEVRVLPPGGDAASALREAARTWAGTLRTG